MLDVRDVDVFIDASQILRRVTLEVGAREVICLVGRIIEGCKDVLSLKERVICQNFVERSACGKQFQNVSNTNALPANTRTPTAFASFNCNSLLTCLFHKPKLTPSDLPEAS